MKLDTSATGVYSIAPTPFQENGASTGIRSTA